MSMRLSPEEIEEVRLKWWEGDDPHMYNNLIKMACDAQISHLASMTDDELVEEIAKINQGYATNFKIKWEDESQDVRDYELKIARQISALLQVKTEETVEKERKRICKVFVDIGYFEDAAEFFEALLSQEDEPNSEALKGEPHD